MKNRIRLLSNLLALLAVILTACAPAAPEEPTSGQPGEPVYAQLIFDCNTGDGLPAEGDAIEPDGGCDSWEINRYERPFNADSQDTFFRDLDLLSAELGSDGTWFYARLSILDVNEDSGYLDGSYGIELDLDIDGRGDVLVLANEPGQQASEDWTVVGVQFFGDGNNDVGDEVPLSPDPPSQSNGYDTLVFDQGEGDDPALAWVRLHPGKPAQLELAFKASSIYYSPSFKWWAWSDLGVNDRDGADYHDKFDHPEAGDPIEGQTYFPSKSIFELDNTCASIWGAQPGNDPELCVNDDSVDPPVQLPTSTPIAELPPGDQTETATPGDGTKTSTPSPTPDDSKETDTATPTPPSVTPCVPVGANNQATCTPTATYTFTSTSTATYTSTPCVPFAATANIPNTCTPTPTSTSTTTATATYTSTPCVPFAATANIPITCTPTPTYTATPCAPAVGITANIPNTCTPTPTATPTVCFLYNAAGQFIRCTETPTVTATPTDCVIPYAFAVINCTPTPTNTPTATPTMCVVPDNTGTFTQCTPSPTPTATATVCVNGQTFAALVLCTPTPTATPCVVANAATGQTIPCTPTPTPTECFATDAAGNLVPCTPTPQTAANMVFPEQDTNCRRSTDSNSQIQDTLKMGVGYFPLGRTPDNLFMLFRGPVTNQRCWAPAFLFLIPFGPLNQVPGDVLPYINYPTATPTATNVPRQPTSTSGAPSTPQCNDGKDNDGDGDIDGRDKQCSSPTDNNESS